MKYAVILMCMLVVAGEAFAAKNAIVWNTAIPVMLSSTVNAKKSRPGEKITARVMQDVRLPDGRKIPERALLIGSVVDVKPATAQGGASVVLRFDRVQVGHREMKLVASLRAVASMVEVEFAQLPKTG